MVPAPEEPEVREEEAAGSGTQPTLGFVERRQAEEARADRVIERIKDMPLPNLSDMSAQESGRPWPPIRAEDDTFPIMAGPITHQEIAAGKIRVASDSGSAEQGNIQERTIIPGPDGPTTV